MAQTNKVLIENQTLLQNPIQTFLTSDLASGSASATVKNITGFAVNQVLILGELGNEGTELIYTHASTAPTGSTITFSANTVFPHSSGTPLYVIDFDEIEISNATPSATSTKNYD